MRRHLLVVLVLCVAAVPALALYARLDLETVPIDRVVTNLERMISENPTSIETRLNLARLHAMAYASKATEVPTLRTGFPNSPGWEKGQPYFGRDQAHA